MKKAKTLLIETDLQCKKNYSLNYEFDQNIMEDSSCIVLSLGLTQYSLFY